MKLSEACDLLFHPTDGKYVSKTDWVSSLATYLQRAIGILGDIDVDEITPAHYRQLWRGILQEHVNNPSTRGIRSAEGVVGAVRTLMNWLAKKGKVSSNYGRPEPHWKQRLEEDWKAVTGRGRVRAQHEYSAPEIAKLWRALPESEPRLPIVVELGAESRLGQVVRTRRSDVRAYAGNEFGTIRVHGRGSKPGGIIVLTDQQRNVLSAAMSNGVLSELERAYESKEIDDYFIIPGGRLVGGKAQVKAANTQLNKKCLRNYWLACERLAGVEHVPGRAWFGLRRALNDPSSDAGVRSGQKLPVLEPTAEEQTLLDILDKTLPTAAASYRQGLLDLQGPTRHSYRGTVAEFRECLREVLDHLAPDHVVLAQAGFRLEQGRTRPTMKQQVRFILKVRGFGKTQMDAPEKSVVTIEERIGEVTRAIYDRASLGTHVTQSKAEVVQIKRFVDTVLFDILGLGQTGALTIV